MEGEKATLIDVDADVEGRLTGKDARILGRFTGEIEVKGRLLMGDGSRVEATVVADAAEISGEFKGDLTVRSLILLERARVSGSVSAQILAVREGAQLNGTVDAAGTGKAKAAPGGPPAGVVAG